MKKINIKGKLKRSAAVFLSIAILATSPTSMTYAFELDNEVETTVEDGENIASDVETVDETLDVTEGDEAESDEVEEIEETETLESEESEDAEAEVNECIFAQKYIDGYKVTIFAGDGVFPENTEVEIETEDADAYHTLEIADDVNLAVGNGFYVSEMVVFDISFVCDGKEIEPDGEVSIIAEPSYSMKQAADDDSEIKVFHVEEVSGENELTEMEVLDAQEMAEDIEAVSSEKVSYTDDSIAFSAESFSEYVVAVITEFTGEKWVSGYEPPERENDIESIYVKNKAGAFKTSNSVSIMSLETLPSSYTLPNLPKLKDQGSFGTCWAFSSMALAETNMMKKIAEEKDFSELHLAYFRYNSVVDPLGGTEGDKNTNVSAKNFLNRGGNYDGAGNILMQRMGAASEEKYPYSDALDVLDYGISEDYAYDDVAQMTSYYMVNINTEREYAKRLIMENGALGISYAAYNSMAAVTSDSVYSLANNAYYNPIKKATNHAVCIVGWDDNFSKSNFAQTPPGDGAWFVRNSWTSEDNTEGYSGYFWMSYYEATLDDDAYSFCFEDATDENVYQYDGTAYLNWTGYDSQGYFANVFTASGKTAQEELSSIAFFTASTNLDYQVEIYKNVSGTTNPKNGTLSSTTRGRTTFAGYQKIDLAERVILDCGEKYSVVIKLSKPECAIWVGREKNKPTEGVVASIKSGQSFISFSGTSTSWVDEVTESKEEYRGNLAIKAYTTNITDADLAPTSISFKNNLSTEGKEMRIGATFTPAVVFTPSNAAKRALTWSSSNTSVATVDTKGIVTAVGKGTATITAHSQAGNCDCSFVVTVINKVSSLTIKGKNQIYIGDENQYSTTYLPENADTDGNVTWSSSDTSIFTVDENGVGIAHDKGTITLTAELDGIEATMTIQCFPHAPKNIKTEVSADSVVTISWDVVPEADRYEIQYPNPEVRGNSSDYTISNGRVTFTDDYYRGDLTSTTRSYAISAFRGGYSAYSWAHAKFGPRYTITYHLGDGTNNPDNPEYYMVGDYVWFEDPTPPVGYTFSGWYEDANYKTRIYDTSGKTSNLNLYAKYSPIYYWVTYSGNGGYALSGKDLVYYDELYTIAEKSAQKDGCTLRCWNTKADGSGNDYYVGDKVKNLANEKNATVTLYAIWESGKYTVKFNPNGGTVTPTSKVVEYLSAYGELPIPTRAGYKFEGWYTSATSGTQVKSTDIYNLSTNTTLYAHWTAKDVTVNFDSCGGSEVDPVTVKFDGNYGSLQSPIRTGYKFDGWYTSKTGGTKIISTSKVSNFAEHTLYAHWTANTYTLYLKNGASSVTVSCTYDVTRTLPENTFTKKGYTFDSWNTAQDGSGTKYLDGAEVLNLATTGSASLYAQWTPNKYKLIYDANGGIVSEASKDVTYDSAVGTLMIPTKKGYTFAGWYTSATSGTKIDAESTYKYDSDVTLYAHWTATSVVVSFDTQGAGALAPKTVKYDGTYGGLSSPNRAGYTFAGWYTDPVAGTLVESTTVVTNEESHTLYAHWEKSKYTVSLDAQNGEDVSTIEVVYEGYYSNLSTPERIGYTFAGWYDTPELDGVKYEKTSVVEKTSDHTLYARWTANSYEVSFALNGGSPAVSPVTVTYDQPYGTLPEVTKTGYEFLGWYFEGSDTKVDETTVVDKAANHTIEAHWKAKEYILTFDSRGGIPCESMTIVYDSVYGELPEASMSGAVFAGWYTEAEGGEKVESENVVKVLDNQTLYARWTYKYTVEDPVFSVTSGTPLEKGSKVSISTATTDAEIYYSTDGEDPVISEETRYEDAIVITEPVTIKAIAVKENYNNSEIVTASYTIKDESDDWGEILPGDRTGFENANEVPSNLWVRGIDDKYYTGKPITFPDLRVYKGKELLKATTDYTVAYKNNTKAGIATVTITGKGNYAGTIVKTFEINKVDISRANAADIVLAYNKRVQKGTTTVTCTVDGVTNTLKANTDFKYVYPNTDSKAADYDADAFKEPDTYTVTIEGNGNYIGTTTFTETITEKKLISKMTVKGLVAKMPYNDGADVIQEKLEVWDGKTKLTEGEDADYTVSYDNNTEIGKATIVITGKGDYIGTKTVTFDITGYNIKSAVFGKEVTGSYPYTGGEIEPLNPETSLTYKKSATDIVTLKGIEKIEYSSLEDSEKRNYDYIFEYSGDTINVGRKGTIIIQGINSYTGTVTKTFSITAKPFDADIEITVAPATYQKGGSKPTVTVKDGEVPLTEGVDYTVTYSNNTKVHDGNIADAKAPTVKITGKGNYKGILSKKYPIAPSDIANVTVAASDIVYQNKAGICKPKITVTDTDGKVLVAGTDYEKDIKYTYVKETKVSRLIDAKKKTYKDYVIEEGTEVDPKIDIIYPETEIKVSVTGKGNYAGTDPKETTFRFVSADISKATVTVTAQNYTGRPVTLSKNDITVKIGKDTLKKTDYEIVGYNKNTAKGSAEVIIKGVGNYGGKKTAKFNIVARSMNYTVVYEKNSDDATGSMKTSLTALNGKVTANAFKRQGYTFAGWSFEPDGEVVIKNSGALVLDSPREYGSIIHLYAQWK